MASENGEAFVKSLTAFVRTHEKALATALQLRRDSLGARPPSTSTSPEATQTSFLSIAQSTGVSSLTAALSSAVFPFSHPIKPVKLTLTPHHLFYLLSRFEELGIDVGPMNVRLENIHAESAPTNYVSFLTAPLKPQPRSGKDTDSIHSVSSVRSVMSNMSSFWTGIGGSSTGSARSEKARASLESDTKYLYSAFTKIPCLRLSQDRRARLISGYEEFPFDTAVPLSAFKNVSSLELYDTDFRQLYGWDRMAEQLRSLTIKRGDIEDPRALLISVVIDDIERRRRRSSKPHTPSIPLWSSAPCVRSGDGTLGAYPGSPPAAGSVPGRPILYPTEAVSGSTSQVSSRQEDQSPSPSRPRIAQALPSRRKSKGPYEMRRSGSGSSDSSSRSRHRPAASRSASSILAIGMLPPTKWRLLRHLSLADNGLTTLQSDSLTVLATSLVSLDLSCNLFTQIPDGLAVLSTMRALNLSNCLIESLTSLSKWPLPAVEAFNLRSNKLRSLMGLEKLFSLERLDIRENRIADPTELARLTGIPGIRELYVAGNPFTKTHSTYRIHIFNLFRSAPGYIEDIRIDGSGPSYTEKKQLKDRIISNLVPPKPRLSHSVVAEAHVVKHPSSSRSPSATSTLEQSPLKQLDPTESKGPKKGIQSRKRMIELSTEPLPATRRTELSTADRQDVEPAVCCSEGDSGKKLASRIKVAASLVPSRGSSIRLSQQHAQVPVRVAMPQPATSEEAKPYRQRKETSKVEHGSMRSDAINDASGNGSMTAPVTGSQSNTAPSSHWLDTLNTVATAPRLTDS